MKITTVIALVLSIALVSTSAFAQEKGASALIAKQTVKAQTTTTGSETNLCSAIVKEKTRASYSVHSRGFIQNPKTGAVVAEIVTFRERGLWGNGCMTQMLLNDEGKPIAILSSSASAGPGVALIQGASFVGGMYLFAEHLRPSNVNSNNKNSGNSGTGSGNGTTVNNNLSSTSNGGSSNATGGSSNATGGAGGAATSTATGGSSEANNTVSGGVGSGGAQSVIVNSGDAKGKGQIIFGGEAVNPIQQ